MKKSGFLRLYQNNSEEHCTQVYEKKLLKDPQEFQIFHNSITIMQTLKTKPCSPKLYEDNNKYYILGEKMKLQSLENLLLNGFNFQEIPLVSIIYMILQYLQKYQKNNIYHGNINIKSVFINIENENLEIVMLYPRYVENSNYTIENDLYNLGILIYQITFYTMTSKINQQGDLDLINRIHNQMADQNYKENQYNCQYKISQFCLIFQYQIIKQYLKNEQFLFSKQKKQQLFLYPFLYRVSQLDLIRQLLSPNITLNRAIKHQWFITIQQNIKHYQTHQQLNPNFLRTIVEISDSLINSPHVNDGRMVNYNHQQSLLEQGLVDPEENQPIKCQIINTIRMIPSKIKHDEASQYIMKSKTVKNSLVQKGSLSENIQQTTVK